MRLSRTAALALILLFTTSCRDRGSEVRAASTAPDADTSSDRSDRRTPPPATPRAPVQPVQIEMRNVRLHVDEGIVLDVAHLRGEMISKVNGRPPVFDDGRSYVLRLASAEIAMDMASLGALMNRHVFGYEGAPLKDLEVEATDDGRLEQKGKLHKGIDIPFSMKASVSATPDGRLMLHADSMKAAGVPAKGVLDLFGIELDDLAKLERRGLSVKDNDITIAVGQVLPPPEIQGRLTRVSVSRGRLLQTFAPETGERPRALKPPDPRARNYIYFSGGSITFGKLTMSDADLQLIDADMRDPFDFFPARYNAQLVAGYSKNTPQLGLKTYMPDYGDLGRRAKKTPNK